MHRLLKRQIKKVLGPDAVLAPDIEALLDVVSATYEQHDADRQLLQRSMDLSSVEFMELNEQLAEEVETQKQVLSTLKESIRALHLDTVHADLSDEDVLSLAGMLEEQILLRNQAEQRLRENEEGLRLIVEGVKDYAIYTLNHEGCITRWNAAAERIYGYTADEAIGAHLSQFFTPEDVEQDAPRALIQEAMEKGRAETEGWRVRKDGSVYWSDVILTRLHTEAGDSSGFVKITRDATARKQAEEALWQAKSAAEMANQAKSDFLANMSHEIRTPMNAVIGMTSLLLETILDAEQQDYVETIRTGGETLLSVINDILDFSKIEAGMLELEAHPFAMHKCVEDTLDLFSRQARERGIELAYCIDADTPAVVVGDMSRVRQVLVNLVGNAVKFTETGGIVVSVTSQPESSAYVQLQVSVQDTGIGIPKDRMGRLFKSFSQVDSSTTRRYGGTGLGLAICKRLTELMGGRIWVESDLGVGTTFHFTLRVAVLHDTRQPSEAVSSPSASLEGRRVLIVDDSAVNRHILVRQVQQWGMVPTAFASGQEALQCLTEEEAIGPGAFDCAVFDLRMPEIDGLRLATAVHGLPATAALPIVLLSSTGDLRGREQEVRHHTVACLSKPVKQHRLRDVLVNALTGSKHNTLSAPESISALDSTLATTTPLRILLAEDNLVNQKVALRILERLGYRADAVANGEEAIHALAQRPYDVVLMDVHMPEMDGLEATRQIRATLEPDRQPHIIAMTANVMPEDKAACHDAGMNDFVTKPVDIQRLVTSLQQVVRLGSLSKTR